MPMMSARWQCRLVAGVVVLGLAVWFSATAIAPSLRAEWGLGDSSVVWLTASVQLGFAAGAVGSSVAGLADRFPAHLVMAASAFGAGVSTLVFCAVADGLATAIPLRALTGMFLAGVYPVGMKLVASWAKPVDRGRAFGLLIGALTLGSALPHLIAGFGPLPWRTVMICAAGLSLVAGVVSIVAIRPGPLLTASARPRARFALESFRRRGPLLVNLGYFGHMWELYAFWAWLPAFVIASSAGAAFASPTVSLVVFATIGLAGAVGALVGGCAADRYGRPAAAGTALAVSGLCCVVSPWFFQASPALLLVFLAVWGAAVIADSGVFSTAMSEASDQRYVGTALTVQTAVGFTLTVVTIQLTPLFASAAGWQYAFWLLAPGPVIGVVAMSRFGAMRRSD